jgi:hypothetical protein
MSSCEFAMRAIGEGAKSSPRSGPVMLDICSFTIMLRRSRSTRTCFWCQPFGTPSRVAHIDDRVVRFRLFGLHLNSRLIKSSTVRSYNIQSCRHQNAGSLSARIPALRLSSQRPGCIALLNRYRQDAAKRGFSQYHWYRVRVRLWWCAVRNLPSPLAS